MSSVSLASLNLADNDKDLPNNRKNNRWVSHGNVRRASSGLACTIHTTTVS